MNWAEKILEMQTKFELALIKPAPETKIKSIVAALELPESFQELYLVTNGIIFEWFSLLPIEDVSNIKNTWDSLQKANDPIKTRFNVDDDFLKRFIVFADIGDNECAVYDRNDGTIWYQTTDELQQTDLSLEEFIEVCLQEVDKL